MQSSFDINKELGDALILHAKIVYKTLNKNELTESIKKLKAIKNNEAVSEEIKKKAEGIEVVAYIKYLLLGYEDSNFDPVYSADVTKNATKLLNSAITNELKLSITICQNAINAASLINSYIKQLKSIVGELTDEMGNPFSKDEAKYNDAVDAINQIKEAVEALEEFDIFNSNKITPVKLKPSLISTIDSYKEKVVNALESVIADRDNKLFKEILKPIDSFINYNAVFCLDGLLGVGTSNLVVVSSPYIDEINLLAYSYSKNNNIDLVTIDLKYFNEKTPETINSIFESLKNNKKNILFYNFEYLSEFTQNIIIANAIEYTQDNLLMIITDVLGNRRPYIMGLEALAAKQISQSKISHVYLPMPNYNDLYDFFRDRNMLNPITTNDYLRANLPFLGYKGLNIIYKLAVENKDWINEAAKISKANDTDVVRRYLEQIPSQAQLLDDAWGTLIDEVDEEILHSSFDYDSVRQLSKHNVDLIINSKYRIYEKCGLATRYALLHGDDISVWKSLDYTEKQIRTEDALKLVYYLLGIDFVPTVVMKNKILDSDTVAGLCVSHGREIQIRKSSLDEYEDLLDIINHESYHTFQYFTIDHKYRNSWWLDFGITKSMIKEWNGNFSEYISSGKENDKEQIPFRCYRRQVVEAYANCFAADALEGAIIRWSDLDLN